MMRALSIEWKAEFVKLSRLAEREDCSWQTFRRLGELAEKLGDVPGAISWWMRASRKSPVPIPETLKLARLLIEAGRFGEAVPILERYLECFPASAEGSEWLFIARNAPRVLKSRGGAVMAGTLPDYWRWRERHLNDPLNDTLHRERIENLWKQQPLFEVVLILKPGQENLLADSIDGLARQDYPGWRLSIFAPGASPEPGFALEDSPVRWIQCAPEEIGERLGAYVARSPADWFGFFACGTRFLPDTFLTLGDYVALHPEWALIYGDDDSVTVDGDFHSPRFKPDLDLEFLRSTDYVGGFFIARQTLIDAGGHSVIAGAESYDLLLRAIDVSGEAAVGHIPEILAHCPDFAPARVSDEGAAEALRQHFARRKIPVSIEPGLVVGETRHVVYLHEKKPKVSIIIPTKNRLDLLSPCLETLFNNTFWPNWELLIVDNGSDDPNVSVFYDELRERFPEKVKIIDVAGDFDFSAMNNRAAREAEGEYLLLLNNDTECIHGEWLDEMMSHAQRPDVGIVGARLLFPDTLNLQHAGMVLGLAGHVFFNRPHDKPVYLNRAFVDQEYRMLTGACLLIRASIFNQAAGLDPGFKLLFQDTDLCLRAGELGYRVIWTPFATLLHHGRASIKHVDAQRAEAIQRETEAFTVRWKHRSASDPAWNRHLSLSNRIPEVEKNLIVSWNADFHERPRVLYLPASLAETEHGEVALRALNVRGDLHYAVCRENLPLPNELDRVAPDALLMRAPVEDARYASLLAYRKFNPEIFLVYALDELLNELPENHPRFSETSTLTKRIRKGLAASHRLIVATEALAGAFRGMIDDIRVVPDTLEWRVWGQVSSKRRRGKKLRVGWAGAQYAGDAGFMRELVEATREEVDWIFFGHAAEEARPGIAESHEDFRGAPNYAERLAALDLDLALAPLAINAFNEAAGNRRLLEYGILGWPVLCTDILAHRAEYPPVTRLPNDPRKWIEAIRERAGEPDALAREGDALREWVKANRLLENRLDSWLSALTR